MSTVHHGALDYGELAELGVTPEAVIDFSSNCNPWGPPPAVIDALRTLPAAALARYPDRHCLALREKLATLHQIDPSWIGVGNGSAEVIWGLARARLKEGDIAVVIGPTFGEYAAASAACGAQIVMINGYNDPRCSGNGLHLPSVLCRGKPLHHKKPSEVSSQKIGVNSTQTRQVLETCWVFPRIIEYVPSEVKIIWLCNPNNPTGHLWSADEIAGLRDHYPAATIVIDEAYLPFVPDATATPPDEGTVILRSLTKDFGMAGIRLGYLLASAEQVAQVKALLPPWSVSATAQAAGLAAMDALKWREETLAMVRQASISLRTALRAQGWRLHEGAVPFFLLHTDNGAALRAKLLQKGLVVRDCASFGLPEWVRIAPQRPEENQRLLKALTPPTLSFPACGM